jgi:hypothetical protein
VGEVAIGIGMLLAIFGPVLLLPATWVVYRFAVRQLWWVMLPDAAVAAHGWLAPMIASVVLVLGSVGASYAWGKAEFTRLCVVHGTPEIHRTLEADGFFRTPLFAYEARQILDAGVFEFVEGPVLRADTFMRYRLDERGGLKEIEVVKLSSQYGVRETPETAGSGTTIMERTVYEIGSDAELARAASLTFMGGPLSIFLGVYGMASCPDIRSPEGIGALPAVLRLGDRRLGWRWAIGMKLP